LGLWGSYLEHIRGWVDPGLIALRLTGAVGLTVGSQFHLIYHCAIWSVFKVIFRGYLLA